MVRSNPRLSSPKSQNLRAQYFTMKTSAILAATSALIMAVSGSEMPIAERGVAKPEIHAFWQNDLAWFGEKAEDNGTGVEKRRCTKCVGHHGKCTIGEGNCYSPDGCYFCGGCNANQARCQDPNSEGCQCY
ncbi:hypothetical protein PGQ11_007651 [Apiospora arundinis]|uniref:Uncharacterized protein n=1 Tax=Apiospora arundinis TaxID=335852 RepID=A0ABR2IWL1_9PEZI